MQEPQVIRMTFEDGVYSFWRSWIKGRTQQIVFRVKETGKNAWHTPQQRLRNLLREVIQAHDPESVEHYRQFTEFAPAELGDVVRWFSTHQGDAYNFLRQHVEYGRMTSKQKLAFKRPA